MSSCDDTLLRLIPDQATYNKIKASYGRDDAPHNKPKSFPCILVELYEECDLACRYVYHWVYISIEDFVVSNTPIYSECEEE